MRSSYQTLRSSRQTTSKLHKKLQRSKKYENTCYKAVMYLPRHIVYSCTRVLAGGWRTVFTKQRHWRCSMSYGRRHQQHLIPGYSRFQRGKTLCQIFSSALTDSQIEKGQSHVKKPKGLSQTNIEVKKTSNRDKLMKR